jgi:hypothetical protein
METENSGVTPERDWIEELRPHRFGSLEWNRIVSEWLAAQRQQTARYSRVSPPDCAY